MNARLLTILAALAAAAAGCVPNDASVRIFGMCTPPTPSATGGCLYSPKCDTMALGQLVSDVASTSFDGPLIWPVQIDNQRPSNKDRDGGVETAYARVKGFKIKYGSATVLAPSQDVALQPGPATIPPGGSTVLLVPVITKAAGVFLSGQVAGATTADVTAEVKVYGTYGDGSSFETEGFPVQATICNGCIPDSSILNYCPDAAKPVLVGVCPQERQSAVVLCEAAAAAP